MKTRIVDSRNPRKVFIGPEHVAEAEASRAQGNPNACVVSCAVKGDKELKNTRGATQLVGVEVRPQITKLFRATFDNSGNMRTLIEERARTGEVLRQAIKKWDDGNPWPLPAGEYELKPMSRSLTLEAQKARAKTRHRDKDPHASGRAPFKLRKAPAFSTRYLEIRRIKREQLGKTV